MSNRKTLFVGAYERANFGDLLFLLISRKYRPEASTVAAAPFSGDMAHLLGHDIPGLAETLASDSFGSVWVVGGEIGGTSMADAYRMSANTVDYGEWRRQTFSGRREALALVSGRAPAASPYLPRMSASPATRGCAFVVNSVGLSGLRGLRGSRRDEAWAAIEEAEYLSVRDAASSQLLTSRDIQHTLAPDLVHTILKHFPQVQRMRQADLALVQVKERVLLEYGPEEFAKSLATSRALRGFRIRLFSAGEARGHDSLELYRRVAAEFNLLSPGRRLEVGTAQRPLDKVAEIAEAGLWIGTSLHGLILSTAFSIPHVGLELEKLARYADTWSDPMPMRVDPSGLDDAIASSLAIAQEVDLYERARDLSASADASALSASAAIESHDQRLDIVGLTELRASRDATIHRRARRPLRRAYDSLEALVKW